ncbi:MAG: lysine--tRNA ligase [Phycisphaerales bacterium]|nr:lysine--tRNA ligase [Phycisphaerales bacterium]
MSEHQQQSESVSTDPSAQAEAQAVDVHHLEQQRRDNRDAVIELGMLPYGERADGLTTLADAHAMYDEGADKANKESNQARKQAKRDHPEVNEADLPAVVDERPRVKVAGRVMLHRDNGKLIWLNLRDHTRDTFQIAVSKRDCETNGFKLAKVLDGGDIVIAEGPLTMTNTGEVTCWADTLIPASKCLVPPPEKHAGLQDTERRYRQRYMDMWANPETTRVLMFRSKMMSAMRRYLERHDFVEVETPVLQVQAGGAAARPFLTHMNALSLDLSLRIAPELYLKRLLVGGMPRVFEVSRNFRNEGLDKSHNPEFTSLEVYQAYGNYETMMELTEGLIRELAELASGEPGGGGDDVSSMPFGDLIINYESPFEKITYAQLFEKALGFTIDEIEKARAECEKRGFKTKSKDGTPIDDIFIINELFEEVAEHAIDPARPTFVMDYPASLSPLTRPKPGTQDNTVPLADRWDIFIGGMEIGPAYTELNDPDIQEAKFKEQLTGVDDEESTFRTFDEDFINALKVGMPPAGGLGLGMDRIVMLLANQRSIRDVLPFPMMKPRE